ncbi:MAG TPA: TIGR01212 family radical SAM protein [Syntrophothermus lipocalidus]|nr:TIGR01212 family radical SAM protein [Syntrophothermus lipocalidus]
MPDLPYRAYSEHLKARFGQKVYKLPVNLAGSCPNRDGNLGWGGCIYCGEEGSGFECLPNWIGVKEQLERNKAYIGRNYGSRKFIAYFQAFTNTYLPLETFAQNIEAAVGDPDIIGLSISTRPDCISDDYLDRLAEITRGRELAVDIELGLQTVNYRTLAKINRGHTLAEFIDAVLRVKQRDFAVCAHLILNLPGDEEMDVVENAKVLSALGVQYVKLHALYILKGTVLGEMYERGEVQIISLDEYVERVIAFLEYLHPDVVIQRLIGRAPAKNTLFCNWGVSWWKIRDMIIERMKSRQSFQGCRCDYLNGKALRKFRGQL